MRNNRRLPRGHAGFRFVAQSGWCSFGFRGRPKSSRRLDQANGEATYWTMRRVLRDGRLSSIARQSARYCDRSTLGCAGASRVGVSTRTASLLVEADIILEREGAGNFLYVLS